ncbi:MAG TPA: winged helix-turn-helix domain-containing protein [Candidatus Dormibacteraeota bacterium]|nr:winged helix-turn-helix domain-containing protein [Candidatus Dormibacteraeota bacterium]
MTTRLEVEKVILRRLATGDLRSDQRLPTCTQLAKQLGANKNTVSKAFQSLASRGYLRSERGRGTFVARRMPRSARPEILSHLQDLLLLALQEAKLAGLDQDRFLALVGEAASRYYGARSLRVGLVECIPHDAAALSRDLQVALGRPVTPLLLEDVVADPAGMLADFDLVGVAVSHIAELEEVLPPFAGPELIQLFVSPDAASLAEVVRLRAGTRVGIVCDAEETLRALLRIVAAYNPELSVSGCRVSDREGVQTLAEKVQALMVTLSARPALDAFGVRPPVIPASFQLDTGSVERMRARLEELSPPASLITAR